MTCMQPCRPLVKTPASADGRCPRLVLAGVFLFEIWPSRNRTLDMCQNIELSPQATPAGPQELMEDPIMAADGFTYERGAIADWLARGNASSPMTGAAMDSTALAPNLVVCSAADIVKRRCGNAALGRHA